MKRYQIKWNGRVAVVRANNCEEAMEKYAYKNLFGKGVTRICNLRLLQYDADTRGEEWIEYMADNKRALVTKL